MWNLNGTSVDMFLKKPVIADARKLLENAKVPFDVVIDDLQHAIDTENPPPEVIEQLQNRKGTQKYTNIYAVTEGSRH